MGKLWFFTSYSIRPTCIPILSPPPPPLPFPPCIGGREALNTPKEAVSNA